MSNATDLVVVDDYIATRSQLFPSRSSYQWFARVHRDELVKAGALVCPTGRWLINPKSFDDTVMIIGARRAAAGGDGT
jgi:hypothetical protein